jgi:AcrR family transcriptional regulator
MDTQTDMAAGAKRPVQQRSRERVERMLAAATELIAAKGSDALKMSEVAEKAGVPIGSLYQFFPDKSAIIRTLIERINAENRKCIDDGLRDVSAVGELGPAFGALFDIYYEMFLADPAMRDIWSGAQADKSLRAVELAESRVIGGMLSDVLKRLNADVPAAKIDSAAFLIMNLGEATIRLAISVDPEEGRRLIDAYKEMAVAQMLALLDA